MISFAVCVLETEHKKYKQSKKEKKENQRFSCSHSFLLFLIIFLLHLLLSSPPRFLHHPSSSSFSQIEHPFIVSLRFAFQTDAKLYMVFDFFNGGELFHYLSTGGRFDAERAKFYAAEIASGMGHLHNIGTPAVCEKSFFFLFFSDDDDEPIKNIYFYIIFL